MTLCVVGKPYLPVDSSRSFIKMPLEENGQAVTHGISLAGDAVQPDKIGLMVTLARAVIAYIRAVFVP